MMSKIRKAARGQECQIRMPLCNGNPDTVVACHANKGSVTGKGIGSKCSDLFVAFGCTNCHDLYDRRVFDPNLTREEVENYFYEGMIRTQHILLEMGLIAIK